MVMGEEKNPAEEEEEEKNPEEEVEDKNSAGEENMNPEGQADNGDSFDEVSDASSLLIKEVVDQRRIWMIKEVDDYCSLIKEVVD